MLPVGVRRLPEELNVMDPVLLVGVPVASAAGSVTVYDHVFEEVLRLRHELRIEANVSCLVVAASPPGFHPLKEIPSYSNVQPTLPFLNQ